MRREGRMPVAARRKPESSGLNYTFPRSGNDNKGGIRVGKVKTGLLSAENRRKITTLKKIPVFIKINLRII